MREIEIKAEVENLKAAEERLAALGAKLSEPIAQADRVFLQKGITLPQVTVNTPVLRIRKQTPGKILLTYKHIRGQELDKQEHEVEISDAEEMEKILQLSGFYESIRFTKRRRKCRLGEYEICLDEVEGLGNFIEIEKLFLDGESETDGQTAQAQLFDFLRQLGAQEQDKVLQGYDVLIYNRVNAKLKSQS